MQEKEGLRVELTSGAVDLILRQQMTGMEAMRRVLARIKSNEPRWDFKRWVVCIETELPEVRLESDTGCCGFLEEVGITQKFLFAEGFESRSRRSG